MTRALRGLQHGLARSLEVSGTVVKFDRAAKSNRFTPTFNYRTVDGQDITSWPLLVFDLNDSNDLPLASVGGTVRLRYDPQNVWWVVPATFDKAALRGLWRKGALTGGLLVGVGALACFGAVVPAWGS
jgi:hypothetical protein